MVQETAIYAFLHFAPLNVYILLRPFTVIFSILVFGTLGDTYIYIVRLPLRTLPSHSPYIPPCSTLFFVLHLLHKPTQNLPVYNRFSSS